MPARTCTRLVNLHGADEAARRSVARHRMAESLLHEGLALVRCHARPEVGVAEAINVRGSRAADGVRPLEQRAADGDGVDLPPLDFVPAGDENARHEHVLVVVAELAEEVGGRLDLGRLAVLHAMLVPYHLHVACLLRLCYGICSRSATCNTFGIRDLAGGIA